MSQHVVIDPPPQDPNRSAASQNPPPPPPPRRCPPPVWEWVVIGALSLLLIAVVVLPPLRAGSGSISGDCGSSACPSAAEGETLEKYMIRCTRVDGYTTSYCAEMWERVKGLRRGP